MYKPYFKGKNEKYHIKKKNRRDKELTTSHPKINGCASKLNNTNKKSILESYFHWCDSTGY